MKKIYTQIPFAKNNLLLIGSFLFLLLFLVNNSAFSQTVVINPTSPWTVPAGVTSVKVEVWGGGGGGGFAYLGYGGGGGGGAYKTATFTVAPAQQYTINIGAGGGSDADGGQSKFTGPSGTLTANGGSAGYPGFFDYGDGGNGAIGDFNGGNGQGGITPNQYGGGGAGNNGNGSNAGAGGGGNPNTVTYRGGNGGLYNNNGYAPGGGGGGASSFNFFSSRDGGSGGKGQIVLTYTVGPSSPTITSFNPATVCAGSGTDITITGTNFTNPCTVTFSNNIAVTATYVSATTIKATLPSGAVSGPIKVSNSIGSDISGTDLTVNVPNVPLTVNGGGTGFCESTIISASGGGGGTIYFEGTNASGTSTTLQSPQTINTSGTYYFRELSACGWGSAYPVTVGINPLPSSFAVNVAATCSSALLTPSGAVGDVFYFQGMTMGGTSTATPGQVTVYAAGTYYYRARTALGCWGPDKSVNVVFAVTSSITSQPVSKEVCVGTNTSFSITATSGTALSYQWRKGTSNITGATSNVLNFTPATAANAGTDYNCVITDACGSLISDYVTLTVNPIAVAPTTQASVLIFPTVGVTSVLGVFTASPNATNYLVVRSNTATLNNPVNGTTYTIGSTAFGAGTYVEYSGPDNSFPSSGLNPGTTYYYFVFAYNINICGGSPVPLYKTPALSNSVTTATSTNCASKLTLYWAGDGSAGPYNTNNSQRDNNFQNSRNWSTNPTMYVYAGAYPTRCNNVVIKLNSNSQVINLSADAEFYDLTFTVSGNNTRIGALYLQGYDLTVYGNAVIDLTGGNSNSYIAIGENKNNKASVIDFKANVTIGGSNYTGASFLYGNQFSKVIVRGDLYLGPTFTLVSGNNNAINNGVPGTLLMDGTGAQKFTWSNTVNYARFNNVIIGSVNNPIVSFSTLGAIVPDNILGDLTINGTSVLNLGTNQWNNNTQGGGTFTMNNSSKLQLAGTGSVAAGGSATLATGSNFPSGFTYAFNGTSTVEYNGANSVTQTIYNIPTYKNLTLTNSSGTGTANKNNAALVTVTGNTIVNATVNANVTMTMGADITTSGIVSVLSNATLLTGSKFISGSGSFNLNSGATLGIGDAGGITSSGAVGNVRVTSSRVFDAGATYIYNGSLAQNTGTGLPVNAAVLTIDNSNGVTINGASTTYSPVQYNQTTGSLALNGKTLAITSLTRNSGTLTGSHTSGVTINGTSIPLFFNTAAEANYTLKTLTLNAGKTADLQTNLNITAGPSAGGSGTLALNTGATLNTYNNLTLKSNQFGTANVGQLPVNGSGVAQATISGNVQVERYINTGTNTAAPKQHGKSWQLLSTAVTGPTIKAAWQENGTAPSGYGTQITSPNYTPGTTHGFDAYSAGPSIKIYNSATDNYSAVPNTDATPLANAKGYYIYIRGDRSVTAANGAASIPTNLRSKGVLNTGRQAAVSIPANKYGTVGNPYAAPVDIFKMHQNGDFANLTNELYVWDPSLGGAYGSGGFIALTWESPAKGYRLSAYGTATYPTKYVSTMQSGQAFFVKSNGVGASSVTFNEADKATSDSSRMTNGIDVQSPVTNGITESGPAGILSASLTGSTSAGADRVILDGALAIFGEAYSNNVDWRDGAKINNGANNVSFARAGKLLSVERRQIPAGGDTLYLNLTATSKTIQYQWSIEGEDMNLTPGTTAYLWDKYKDTKTTLNLQGTTTVDFTTDANAASFAADRFKIIFGVAKPLPVTLVSVTAKRNTDKSISVNWLTANEVNLQAYTIERSSNGSNFTNLAIQAPASNNGGGSNYLYNDISPLGTDNYYRIKALSKDGGIQYSSIVKVEALKAAASISVYPNPVVNREMNISFVNQPAGDYKLELVNKLGQVMYRGKVNVGSSFDKKKVSLAYVTASGMYRLNIQAADGSRHTIELMVSND